jgi:hypothetical protein
VAIDVGGTAQTVLVVGWQHGSHAVKCHLACKTFNNAVIN